MCEIVYLLGLVLVEDVVGGGNKRSRSHGTKSGLRTGKEVPKIERRISPFEDDLLFLGEPDGFPVFLVPDFADDGLGLGCVLDLLPHAGGVVFSDLVVELVGLGFSESVPDLLLGEVDSSPDGGDLGPGAGEGITEISPMDIIANHVLRFDVLVFDIRVVANPGGASSGQKSVVSAPVALRSRRRRGQRKC